MTTPSTPVQEVGTAALLEHIQAFHAGSKHCEALLLALAASGMTLRDALELTTSDLGENERDEMCSRLRQCSQRYRKLFPDSIVSFERLVTCLRSNRPWFARTLDHAFVSRKGLSAPTHRAIEHRLHTAAKTLPQPRHITYRDAVNIGRRAASQHADFASGVLEIQSLADRFIRRSFSEPADFADVKQEIALRLILMERRRGSPISTTTDSKPLVSEMARHVKNDYVKHKRLCPLVLIPHYKWISAADERPDSGEESSFATAMVGLNQVHAMRFRRIQKKLATSFRGVEREIVSRLFGISSAEYPNYSCRTMSVWQIARSMRVSATYVIKLEGIARKRADSIAQRISWRIHCRTKAAQCRSLAHEVAHRRVYHFV